MTTSKSRPGERLARGLGWFSVGLGAAQLLAPDLVDRAIGLRATPRTRAVTAGAGGLRELAVGAAILARRRPPAGLAWVRVAGDALDLAMLGRALRHPGNARGRVALALASVAGVTAADVLAGLRLPSEGGRMELTASTTVRKPVAAVYGYWRQLENLPEFMAHLEEVTVTGERTSRWRAAAPFGGAVEWTAEITDDVPDQRVAWRSTGDADVPNAGEVRFLPAPDGESTEVHVRLSYDLPGGKLGKAVATYFGDEPHQVLDDDLRRVKQVLETGEVVRSDGAPWGKRARSEFPQRPARPMSPAEVAELLGAEPVGTTKREGVSA